MLVIMAPAMRVATVVDPFKSNASDKINTVIRDKR
jgi:hypothetical protein